MPPAAHNGPSEDVARIARQLGENREFSALADATPCLVLGLSAGGQIGYASASVAGVDLEPGALIGKALGDVLHPEDAGLLPPLQPAGGDGASAQDLPWRGGVRLHSGARVRLEVEGWHDEFGVALAFVLPDPEPSAELSAPGGVAELVHRAAHASNNLIVIADARQPDLPLVWVNQHFLEATGYAAEEVIGRNCRFLQARPDGSRDDDQRGLAELREAIAEERGTHVLLRNYRKDGTLFWNELYVTPLFDRDTGALTHFVGVQNDVTERVEASARVAEQQAQREALFDSAPVMVGVVELVGDDMVHHQANRRMEPFFRTSVENAIGKTQRALGFTEREATQWRAAFGSARREGGAVTFETNYPWDSSAAQRTHALTVTVSQIAGTDGLFAYVVEDVTARQRLEQQRRLLEAAVEAAADAVMITDAELDPPGPHVLFVNSAFTRMTGYAAEEIMGQSPRLLQGVMTERATLDRLRRQLKAGQRFRGEAVNYQKDGTPFVLEWEAAPVRDAHGRITHFVSTQRDITDRRRLQREMLVVNASEQARTARDLHDGFGQTLAGAALLAGSLERRAAGGASVTAGDLNELRRYVEEATVQARAIARAMYPVDASGQGLMPSLQAFADAAERASGVSVSLDCDQDVHVEPQERAVHVYRVVEEAVGNALRHAAPGSVSVRLHNAGRGDFELAVEDDGAGITDEALEQQRGLGLYALRFRAEQLGGHLEVERRDAGGTAVQLVAPMRAAEGQAL